MRKRASALATALLTLLAACERTVEPELAAKLDIAADTLWVVEGKPAQVTAEARADDGGLVDGRPVAWAMRVIPSLPGPFNVDPVLDERGMVQARGNARAVVTATADGASDSVVVITEARADSVRTNIAAPRLEVAVGARLIVSGFGVRVGEAGVSGGDLLGRWISSDAQVVQVDTASAYPYAAKQKIVARRAGTARVEYTFGGASKSFEVVVRDVQLASTDARGRCGLTSDGSAWCKGANSMGQVGSLSATVCTKYCFQDDANVPFRAAGDLKFTSLVSGFLHSCGLTADGTAYCWGRNQEDQLGAPAAAAECAIGPGQRAGEIMRIPCSFAPVAVQGGLRFRSLEAAEYATCGVAADGRRFCWGAGYGGAPKLQ